MGMKSFTPSQNRFRFYEDGTESGSTPIAAENTAITRDADGSDVSLHLRILIQENGGADGNSTDDYRLQYSLNGGSYTNVTASSGVVLGFDSSNLTDGNATTNRATNGITDGTGSFVAGEQCEDGLLDNHQLTADNFTEHLYSITLESDDLAYGDSINFRVLVNGSTMTYNVTPNIIIASGTATYYFDGSDLAASDPDASWNNETNADDGDVDTDAQATVAQSSPDDSADYLEIHGTNAPSSGNDIVSVYLRYHDGSNFTSYSNAVTAPSGGWTWGDLQALEMRVILFDSFPLAGFQFFLYEDGNAGGTQLDFINEIQGTGTSLISKIELLVYLGGNDPPTVALNTADETEFTTATPTLEFTGTDPNGDDVRYNIQIAPVYYFDANGGTTDSGAVWTDDANAFDGDTGTYAYQDYGDIGNVLRGDGSNAPGSGFTISAVFARFYYSSDTISATWSSWQSFSDPTGGWTWSVVQNLYVQSTVNLSSEFSEFAAFTSDDELLAVPQGEDMNGSSDYRWHKTEILVIGQIDAVSGTDAGFANTTDGGDTDPFDSGDKADYDVQAGDALDNGTYTWRVRAIDPNGSNTYGAWTSFRTFTVNVTGGARRIFVIS